MAGETPLLTLPQIQTPSSRNGETQDFLPLNHLLTAPQNWKSHFAFLSMVQAVRSADPTLTEAKINAVFRVGSNNSQLRQTAMTDGCYFSVKLSSNRRLITDLNLDFFQWDDKKHLFAYLLHLGPYSPSLRIMDGHNMAKFKLAPTLIDAGEAKKLLGYIPESFGNPGHRQLVDGLTLFNIPQSFPQYIRTAFSDRPFLIPASL